MNVYIYGGKSRQSATEMIVGGNLQPSIDSTYKIPASKGLLIVAYPNQDKIDTELSFNYWVEADKLSEQSVGGGGGSTNNTSGGGSNGGGTGDGGSDTPSEDEESDSLFVILCVAAAVLLLIIIIIVVFVRRRNQEKIK